MNAGSQFAHSINDYINQKAMNVLEERLEKFAKWAVQYSIDNRAYQSFTGNTVTSLTAGIYRNGKLTTMISSSKKMPAPVRVKIKDGKSVFLDDPYEGDPRWVRGKVGLGVKPEFGYETALDILNRYKTPSNVPLAMVMCVGTEYASYIEQTKGLKVLSQTWVDADPVAIQILTQSISR